MWLTLPHLLSADEVRAMRTQLADDTLWTDGRTTAGAQAVHAKRNQQLAPHHPIAQALQDQVLAAARRSPLFVSAALPSRWFTPLFNRYQPDFPAYGPHIDGAVLHSQRSHEAVRTDLSCTLFLSDPGDYDGGELTVHDAEGSRGIKLPAGHAVLYPGNRLHEVTPVTRGQRVASVFWVQSLVRSEEQRRLLFDMDMALLALRQQHGETPATTRLTGTYHNLLRLWAET